MLLGTIRQFIVVGMIAPSVFIGSMVIHLAEHEDVQQQLRADPSLIPRGGRRVPPPADAVPRLRADADARRRRSGRLIRKDEPVAVVFASANQQYVTERVGPATYVLLSTRKKLTTRAPFQ